MKPKILVVLIFGFMAALTIVFLSQLVFGGNCDCNYAYIFDDYRYGCAWNYELISVIPMYGYCLGTTCNKKYKIVCENPELVRKGIIGNAHVITVDIPIYGCCRMTRTVGVGIWE